jgi:hypothetical protein
MCGAHPADLDSGHVGPETGSQQSRESSAAMIGFAISHALPASNDDACVIPQAVPQAVP